MSNRPRKPLRNHLSRQLDTTVPGVYKFTEAGITYELTYEQFNDLKLTKKDTVEEWYNDLNRVEKKGVKRYGNIASEDNGFYPDI